MENTERKYETYGPLDLPLPILTKSSMSKGLLPKSGLFFMNSAGSALHEQCNFL